VVVGVHGTVHNEGGILHEIIRVGYHLLLNSQPQIMHFAYSDWFTQSCTHFAYSDWFTQSFALVGYETGYSQLGATYLVGYLPSHIQRGIIVKYTLV